MASADRRLRERAHVQERILAAARDLFAQHGYEAVTLRRIAAAIEYTPAAIYVHFEDKEDLIRTLCVRDFDELARTFAGLAPITDARARLERIAEEYVRFGLEHPNQYRLMFMNPACVKPDEETLQKKGDPMRDGYSFVRQAFEQAIVARKLEPEHTDADLLTQTYWAGLHGLIALEIALASDPWVAWRDVKARVDLLVRSQLDAWFLARGARRPARSRAKRG
ncbi:MAG: TetR/AcrR family transcriptional regulator [Planctomycetes bacterium]|nr:TetR/AcrR family transcriptional regulator [Planctomycetota bacterium]